MYKKIILLFIILSIIYMQTALAVFDGGGGSVENPYQISTCEQLQGMRDDLNANYILIDDVNCDVSPYNAGAGFESIGCADYFCGSRTINAMFRGTFDGQGHTITGLYINRSSESDIGLFGSSMDAEVKNVGLIDINVSGIQFVGGLIGKKSGGTVNNSYAIGSVIYGAVVAGGTAIGGLVGSDSYGTISNSYAIVSVNGITSVGGLVGSNYHSTVSNSYSTGNVSGIYNVGGLVGDNTQGIVSDSYSTVNVNGRDRVGGLVGYNLQGAVNNSYSIGSVIGSTYVGGLVGKNYSGTVSNSYYDTNTSGQSDTGKGEPKTTEQMKDPATYANWDFVNTWAIRPDGYPIFIWQVPAICGNGIQEAGEECDDGNTVNADGCSATCQLEYDSDGDGVFDDYDKCPNTIDEQVIYGCSCSQILELKPGNNKGELKKGCSKGTIKVFTKQIGWAKNLFE